MILTPLKASLCRLVALTGALSLSIVFSGCSVLEAPFRYVGLQRRALTAVSPSALPADVFQDMGLDFANPETKRPLMQSIDESLHYLQTAKASESYSQISLPGFTPERVAQSLKRFRTLLLTSDSREQFEFAVGREFQLYKAAGRDEDRQVLFTAYCEPELPASRTRNREFQYPVFRLPADFSSWGNRHPSRVQLEGHDGRGALLRGSELFFLPSRFDVIFTQIQGSALLRTAEGARRIGFAGATQYPFKSIAMALIRDGHLTGEQASGDGLRRFFRERPQLLDQYAAENDRVVFFKELPAGGGPTGCLGRQLVAERSFAADRREFPAGGLAVVRAELPFQRTDGMNGRLLQSRFLLDQDTGSAIKGRGRVDIFLGSGESACSRAGSVKNRGSLYYLLLRDAPV